MGTSKSPPQDIRLPNDDGGRSSLYAFLENDLEKNENRKSQRDRDPKTGQLLRNPNMRDKPPKKNWKATPEIGAKLA